MKKKAKLPKRAYIRNATVAAVLKKSRRRCAFCFGLERDTRQKRGQIAHINHERADFREANLAWLCLGEHHDQYDSRTRQSRNLTSSELRHYKKELESWVRQGMAPLGSSPNPLVRPGAKRTIRKSSIKTRRKVLVIPKGLRPLWTQLTEGESGRPLIRMLVRNNHDRSEAVISEVALRYDGVDLPWESTLPCFSTSVSLDGRMIQNVVLMPTRIRPGGECAYLRYPARWPTATEAVRIGIRYHLSVDPGRGRGIECPVQVAKRESEVEQALKLQLVWKSGEAGRKPGYELVLSHSSKCSMEDVRVRARLPEPMGLAIPQNTGGWYQLPSIQSPSVQRTASLHPQEPWIVAHLRPLGGQLPEGYQSDRITFEVFARDCPRLERTLTFDPAKFMTKR